MYHSITLTLDQRATLLCYYRTSARPQLRSRAHSHWLLDDGRTWEDIARTLYCSRRTSDRWRRRFLAGGLATLGGQPVGAPCRLDSGWAALVLTWVLTQTPRAFGFVRSRWCCATAALLLGQQYGVAVSRETIRRWLHQAAVVWRRPRPVLLRSDPNQILGKLRALLRQLPDDETALFEDESISRTQTKV